MSSDLWAEFAKDPQDPSANPWSQSSADVPATPKESNHAHISLAVSLDTCDQPPSTKSKRLQKSYAPLPTTEQWTESTDQHQIIWGDEQSDVFSSSPWNASQSTRTEESLLPASSRAEFPVLMPQEEDFGDFAEVEAVPTQTPQPSSSQMASAFHSTLPKTTENNVFGLLSAPTVEKDMHHDPWAGVESLGRLTLPTYEAENDKHSIGANPGGFTPIQASESVHKSTEVPYEVEEWGEFSPDLREFAQPSRNQISPHGGSGSTIAEVAPVTLHHSSSAPEEALPKKTAQPKTTKLIYALPPTNVPPPSILLSFLSTLILALPQHVAGIICQAPSPKANLMTLSNAQIRCLLSFRVATRILAGRKLRWKRDIHLSQSMKIGPASAGRSGGMKLTGVDKAEAQREDREAAEIVRVWKTNLGTTRAALAASNGRVGGPPLVLPEISEQPLLRTAKVAEGAITATKSCFLCGLKRDERISILDDDISDSLGEWWADYWGHVECQSFWEQYEQLLRERG